LQGLQGAPGGPFPEQPGAWLWEALDLDPGTVVLPRRPHLKACNYTFAWPASLGSAGNPIMLGSDDEEESVPEEVAHGEPEEIPLSVPRLVGEPEDGYEKRRACFLREAGVLRRVQQQRQLPYRAWTALPGGVATCTGVPSSQT
jgi:hypothetical protein